MYSTSLDHVQFNLGEDQAVKKHCQTFGKTGNATVQKQLRHYGIKILQALSFFFILSSLY